MRPRTIAVMQKAAAHAAAELARQGADTPEGARAWLAARRAAVEAHRAKLRGKGGRTPKPVHTPRVRQERPPSVERPAKAFANPMLGRTDDPPGPRPKLKPAKNR